jgi:hypothetical protein
MGEASRTEQTLVDAIHAMADEEPGRLAEVVGRSLEERGIRCLLVTSRTGSAPSVVVTLTVDDVTAEAVRRVVTPVLRKAGLAEEAIPMMSGAAGAAVSGWLEKQRAKRQARPVEPEGSWEGPPKWSPGRRR